MLGWFRRKNEWGTHLKDEVVRIECAERAAQKRVESLQDIADRLIAGGAEYRPGHSFETLAERVNNARGWEGTKAAFAETFMKRPSYPREFAYRLAPWIAA